MSTMPVNPLNCFFERISTCEIPHPVITKALAIAVVAELNKKTYNTLADVEKMILDEHTAPIQKIDGRSEISEIKVHCRKPINLWTPKTGEEMRALFKHRVQGDVLEIHRVEGDDNYVDLCPTNNPGVWMKLKMRQEFEDFNK
jgi:hypothetical protein